MRLLLIFQLLLLVFGYSCAPARITEKPVVFDSEREELSLSYMRTRYYLERERPFIEPKMIVLHWTAIPTLEKSFQAFEDPRLPGTRPDIQSASSLNVSAHFLVDRNGKIYRLLPETTMARHVIGLNHCAIGIENVGGTDDTPLTKKQLKANIHLVKYLKEKFPDIEYLIGHYEYTLFEDHPLWLEVDQSYRTEKTDPGISFMQDVRKATESYNWKPIPDKNKKQ